MYPKLSIIIPIYNVESYLPRCLDSIISQTFRDFEAILIDDGSPDKCGEIINEYARRDSRFICVYQKNRGVSAARNAGLKRARGEYIGFVDPDDWIEPQMYEILVKTIEEHHCDLASCIWVENMPSGKRIERSGGLESKVMNKEEYFLHLFDMPPTIYGSVCTKLFRKVLIDFDFNIGYSICEDNLFLAQYCKKIIQAIHLDLPLYQVFNRNDSATRSTPNKPALGLPTRREIINVAMQVSDSCGWRAQRSFLDQCIHFCDKKLDKRDVYYQFAKKEFVDYYKENMKQIKGNKQMTMKSKVFFLLEYMRLTKEKG